MKEENLVSNLYFQHIFKRNDILRLQKYLFLRIIRSEYKNDEKDQVVYGRPEKGVAIVTGSSYLDTIYEFSF